MQTPSTLYLWLGEQAGPLVTIALFLSFVMIVLYLSARNRRARMNEVRSGENEDTFVDALCVFGFDPQISRATYQYLQEAQGISFPIKPEDLLDEDLGLDGAGVEESLRDLLRLTGRVYEPGRRVTPLVTVEDLVRLVQASPRRPAMRAAAA